MGMTRKHFVSIASAIACVNKTHMTEREKTLLHSVVRNIARACYRHNPNFCNQTFVDACELPRLEDET
jgi:hypothetical protein